jgi:hypothetical protein
MQDGSEFTIQETKTNNENTELLIEQNQKLEAQLAEAKEMLEMEIARRKLYESELKQERETFNSSILLKFRNSDQFLQVEIQGLKQENSLLKKERDSLKSDLSSLINDYRRLIKELDIRGNKEIKEKDIHIKASDINTASDKEDVEITTKGKIKESAVIYYETQENSHHEYHKENKQSSVHNNDLKDFPNKVVPTKQVLNEVNTNMNEITNERSNLNDDDHDKKDSAIGSSYVVSQSVHGHQKTAASPTKAQPTKLPPKSKPESKIIKPPALLTTAKLDKNTKVSPFGNTVSNYKDPFASMTETNEEDNVFENASQQINIHTVHEERNDQKSDDVAAGEDNINRSNNQINTSGLSSSAKELANTSKELTKHNTKTEPSPYDKQNKTNNQLEYDWDHLIDPITDTSLPQIYHSSVNKKDPQLTKIAPQNVIQGNERLKNDFIHDADEEDDDHFGSVNKSQRDIKPINNPLKPIPKKIKPVVAQKQLKPNVAVTNKKSDINHIFGEDDDDVDNIFDGLKK